MAKQRTITRTIDTVSAEVFVLDINTGETTKQRVSMTGKVTDSELLDYAKDWIDRETIKVVALVPNTRKESSGLYEVTEKDFLSIAKWIGDGR